MNTHTSSLHEERLDEVASRVRQSGCTRIVDLGCGTGSLMRRLLLDSRYSRIHGLEQCGMSLRHAREMLAEVAPDDARLTLQQGSWLDPGLGLTGFDGAVMVETIEHVDPGRLSGLQRAIFETLRPDWLLVTTPNAEFNPLFDLAPGEFRDPDHRFEWPRDRFREWAASMARRTGYRVRIGGIGEADPELGPPTQIATFTRIGDDARRRG